MDKGFAVLLVAAMGGLIAAQAPIAVQFAKRTLARSLDNSLPAQLEQEWPYQVAAFDTDDAREGIKAFRERRSPRFTGR